MSPQNRPTWENWLRLSLAVLVIGVVWGWLLPWVGKFEVVQQREAFLTENKIDQQAMFYTELEFLP